MKAADVYCSWRLALAAGLMVCHLPFARAAEPQDLPLVFSEDFESRSASRWRATDPQVWRVEAEGDNHIFRQIAQSNVQTPVRSPFNRAIVSGVRVGDFQLDLDVRSTTRDYPHRDVCVMFGYQDPTHFYYVHFGLATDDYANQIFIVNEAPRVKISSRTTDGTPWTNDWHHVRIVRRVESGEIAVYFDDMEHPAMTATDTTFQWGTVGIGTFDDTADFDNIELRGVTVERPDAQ